jgi:hypothetical protein
VLDAAEKTETTQENFQDYLELDERDPGFQLLTHEEIAAIMFFIYFHQHNLHIIKFSVYFFVWIFVF